MQRLVEQPIGQGDVVDGARRVGRVHYHLAVYQHFAGDDGDPVPPNVEVEGRVTAPAQLVEEWHRAGRELTLRLSDGRALDFRVVHEDGTIHSTGRGLHASG
jgi:hypothetical protein